ncbi:MAG: hypothetical protein ACUVWJ_03870, partial [Spirochaetota bacterium]
PYPLSVGFGSGAIYDSYLYNFGGTATAAPPSGLNIVYRYNLEHIQTGEDDWQACKGMPVGRYGHVAVTIQQ